MVAAKWMGDNTKNYKLKIITTDKRFLFYTGRNYRIGDASLGTDSDAFYSLDTQGSSYDELEQVAIKNQFDLIMLKISSKESVPQFKHFKRIKEFKGIKNTSFIYSSPEVADKIGDIQGRHDGAETGKMHLSEQGKAEREIHRCGWRGFCS